MKRINSLLCCLTIITVLISSCEQASDTYPEKYSGYLTVKMTSINNSVEDSIYQIEIVNSQNIVFEKDCNLIFSLTNIATAENYSSIEDVVNKKTPEDPGLGYLNLQNGGLFTVVSNINKLNWKGKYINRGDYYLQVALFIDDPTSPENTIFSNRISFKKN
jgi:hypothetical protein